MYRKASLGVAPACLRRSSLGIASGSGAVALGKATLPNLRTHWAGKTAPAQTVAAGFVGATTTYIDSALVGRGADRQHRSARDAAVRDPLSRSQGRIDSE